MVLLQTVALGLTAGCALRSGSVSDSALQARFPDAALDDRALCAKLAAAPPSAAFHDAEPLWRRKVIVSDLHMGAGDWDPRFRGLEDFYAADVLQRFLDDQGAAGPTDLIINGDFLEVWQVLGALDLLPSRDHPVQPPGAPMLASDQEAAVIALQAIVSAHHQELSAIGRFLNGGDHRVVIVPGNHDADLLWPKVQLALAQAIRPSDPARLLFVPGAIYRHGGVHVEHGHRFDSANRTMNDRPPFALDTQGTCRILASWGEVFVARFFNRTEQRFPFVDNLHPESATLLWALEEEPERLAVAQSAGLFLELLLSQQSRALNLAFLKGQLLNMLGLPAGRDDSLGALPGEVGLQLLDRFSSEDRVLEGIWRVLSDPALAHVAESLIDAVRALPDVGAARAALNRITPSDIEALRTVLLGDPQTTAATRILDENPALSAVVLGHTHVPGGLVEDIRSGGRTGHYANSGSWIPVARVADLRRSGLAWTSLDVRDRRLFPSSFPAVIIDYAGSQPMRPRVTSTRGSFP